MTGNGHFRVPAAVMAAALAAVLAAGLLALVKPAEAAFPGQNGRIFFETPRDDGRTNVYSINPDGTGATDLPRSVDGIADETPAVSPDGSRVAYEHDRDIWVMNVDGTGPRPVTTDGAATQDLQPAWSPDGARIAFYGITSSSREVYTIKADGSDLKPLTSTPTQDEQPVWSPDGTKIAYVVCCHDIWVMNADGTGNTNLTENSTFPGVAGDSLEPNWSPDGTRIVFTAGPHCDFSCTGTDIYVMNAGGGGEVNLTPNDENHFQPVFSPDGTKIAFTSNTINGTNFDIFTMNANGSGRTSLTNDAAQDGNPDWGPLDTIPPETAITSGPSGTVASNFARFWFSSSEGGSFRCSLDGAPFEPCSSPKDYAGLPNGPHAFRVKAVDVAGNEDATPAQAGWTVNVVLPPPPRNTPPTISGFRPAPGSMTRDATPLVAATVRDRETNLTRANVRLWVDGRRVARFSYDPRTDRLTHGSRALGKGRHTVKIAATDGRLVATRAWSFRVVIR